MGSYSANYLSYILLKNNNLTILGSTVETVSTTAGCTLLLTKGGLLEATCMLLLLSIDQGDGILA